MDIDPTARLERLGVANIGDDELLSVLLCRGAVPGPRALASARSLLGDCGPSGLAVLRRRGQGELCRAYGIGPARARALRALFELARRMGERPLQRGATCDNPMAVFESLRTRLGQARQEHFVVLLLDSRLRKLEEIEICRGGANSVFVDPRAVFGPALREGASALVLVHNHPSGDPRPSGADINLTERLSVAGELIGVEVVDHIVISDGSYYSLSEHGEMPLAAGEGRSAG